MVMKRQLEKQVAASQQSFSSIAKQLLQPRSWSHHHFERNSGLVRVPLANLGALPIDSIEEAFLFDVLKKIYDGGIGESGEHEYAVRSSWQALHLCSINQQDTGRPWQNARKASSHRPSTWSRREIKS